MNLELRKVQEKDIEFLFELANDQNVRDNSFKSDTIGWAEHQIWFNSKIRSNTTKMYILLKNNLPVGQIRFDLVNREWNIDYSILANHRGLGLGKKIISMGIDKLNKPSSISAEVKKSNVPSKKIFESLGFKISIDKEEYIIYKHASR